LTEQPFRRHFLDELPRAGENVSLVDVTGLPLSELMQRLAALPADAAILYTAITTDGLGTDYLPVDALKILAERTNRPIIFDVENRLGYGGTGGFVLVPRMAGQEAAQLALQLFSGEKASTIPITTSSAMKLVFDGRELDRWKVDEGRLPAGSEIRNRPISTWNEYRIQVIAVCAALLLQGTLISWLLVEHHYRRAAETEARDTMAELAHLNRIATAGELSASIAHEVSQPLTGIVTRANAALNWLASETPNLGKARMALTQIVTAGHRAGEIVTSTRAMFKKEAKHETEININDLVSAVMPLARIEARKYHIAVQEQLGDSLPTTTGNDVQLQQLILNLLMNAIESLRSAPGRRLVRVITENGHPGGLHVSIEDTGSGIRPSDVDQIFKPLFTTKPHGMGMGLAICRSIVESHHGRIWASAAGERGSVFHFTLPANGHEG
jgi:signal transduction histidine kinase